MSLLNALSLARDVAAVALAASVMLLVFISISGASILSGSLAASLVTVAISTLVTFSVFGLIAFFGDTSTSVAPMSVALWAAMALAVAMLGLSAYFYGVRGLWVGLLATIGVALGAVFIWAFAARLGSMGAATPAVAFVLIALMTTSVFGATLRVVKNSPTLSNEASTAFWRPARLLFATPPDWFDCAYATFGGAAARPGLCSFNPPRIDRAPPWSAQPAPSPLTDQSVPRPAEPPTTGSPAAPPVETPVVVDTPGAPSVTTPDFAAVIGQEQIAPPTPTNLRPASDPEAVAGVERDAEPSDDAILIPTLSGAPRDVAAAPLEEASADIVLGNDGQVAAANTPPETLTPVESAPAAVRVDAPESSQTAFICFPLLGVFSDQLCPDRTLTPSDVEVVWRAPGGRAIGAVNQLDCFFDPSRTLHLNVVVDLSEGLLGAMERGGDLEGKIRKVDAVYDAVTRLIGAARALPEASANQRILMSLFTSAGASALQSPWIEQAFGPDRIDRAFDIRSSGQTLFLLQRLKEATSALQRANTSRSLADTLARAIATAPARPSEEAQPVLLVFVDAVAAAELSEADVNRLREVSGAAGAPLFVVELGAIAPSEAMRRVVEASNGAAFGARDATGLSGVLDRAVSRARTFCAVGVTAPKRLFDENVLEVRLRRQMTDGCVLEQIATLDCGVLQMEQRIDPRLQ